MQMRYPVFDWRETLASMFFDSTRPTRFIMLLAYFVCGIGLAAGSFGKDADLRLMFDIAPVWAWVSICGVLTGLRFLGLFMQEKVTYLTRRATPILGIMFWSTLFAAGAHNEPTGLEVLFCVCAWTEVWILARVFATKTMGEF